MLRPAKHTSKDSANMFQVQHSPHHTSQFVNTGHATVHHGATRYGAYKPSFHLPRVLERPKIAEVSYEALLAAAPELGRMAVTPEYIRRSVPQKASS